MLIALLIIGLAAGAFAFVWCLCIMASDADIRMAEMHEAQE